MGGLGGTTGDRIGQDLTGFCSVFVRTRIMIAENIRRQLASGRGRGVSIGILDTGVASTLRSMRGIVASHHEVELNEAGEIEITRSGASEDSLGHGTACAWILHNLAPRAKLHNVKIIGHSPTGTDRKLVAGLRFAIEQGWDILNVSAGTETSREELEDLTRLAANRGTLIIAAKDNHPEKTGFPASLPSVIGVDMDHFDDPLSFRYFPGRDIEVEAHGVYVEAPRPSGGMRAYTGTSFACPHVSAIAARLREKAPDMDVAGFRAALSALSLPEKTTASPKDAA